MKTTLAERMEMELIEGAIEDMEMEALELMESDDEDDKAELDSIKRVLEELDAELVKLEELKMEKAKETTTFDYKKTFEEAEEEFRNTAPFSTAYLMSSPRFNFSEIERQIKRDNIKTLTSTVTGIVVGLSVRRSMKRKFGTPMRDIPLSKRLVGGLADSLVSMTISAILHKAIDNSNL